MISFTKEVKEELFQTVFDIERQKAILCGFLRINGSLCFSSGKSVLTVTSTSAAIIRYIYTIFKSLYGIELKTEREKTQRLTKYNNYYLSLIDKVDSILEDLGYDVLSDDIPARYYKNENEYGGFLAGSFLASGSVNSPVSCNYHLEISVNFEGYAKSLKKFISKAGRHGFSPMVCQRRNKFIVYLKKSDQVSSFLVAMGAVNACMKFENIRVERDMNNSSHRLEMCDAANMQKSFYAAQEQVMMINEIGLSALKTEKAIVVAKARLANPEASLNELSGIIFEDYQLDIRKSNLHHIFRSIKALYVKKTEEGKE